jgi:hypothetical protein
MNAAETQRKYGRESKIMLIENSVLDNQPTAKAIMPNPEALTSRSSIGLPFSLIGGTE